MNAPLVGKAIKSAQQQLREVEALVDEGLTDGNAGQKLFEMRKFVQLAQCELNHARTLMDAVSGQIRPD
jgi:hypothetical protein